MVLEYEVFKLRIIQISDTHLSTEHNHFARNTEALAAGLEGLDPDRDQQGYSATFEELIALETKRRELRNPE